MNHLRSIVVLLLCLTMSVLILCCKKGDTGPAGAQGVSGTQGATGPAGSANVIYSAWVTATNIKDTTIDQTAYQVATVAAPQLVDSILQQGLVMVYINFGSGVFPLPYTSNVGSKQNVVSYICRQANILITRYTFDNSASIPLATSLLYRYIIVPGGKATSSFATATRQGHGAVLYAGDIDYSQMSYDEICKALSIQP